jgi:hypothetical protein
MRLQRLTASVDAHVPGGTALPLAFPPHTFVAVGRSPHAGVRGPGGSILTFVDVGGILASMNINVPWRPL